MGSIMEVSKEDTRSLDIAHTSVSPTMPKN